MEKNWYQRATPKYIHLYQVLDIYDGGMKVGSLLISRKTNEITKRGISNVKKSDVNNFFNRNKPIKEMVDGVDIVARILLENGIKV